MALRICLMTHGYPTRYPVGGAEIFQRQLAQLLKGLGHEVCVICPASRGAESIEDDAGVPVYFVPPRQIRVRRLLGLLSRLPGLGVMREVRSGWDMVERSLGVWLTWRKLNAQRRFDVIQVVDVAGLGVWGVICPFRHVPIIIRAHGVLNPTVTGMNWPGSRFQLWLEKFSLRRADFIAANSHYLCKRYEVEFEIPHRRIGVIYNGFMIPDTAVAGRLDLRNSRGWDTEDIVALFVGRIEYLKGADLLFAALQAVRNSVPNLRAIIVGNVSTSFQAEYEEFMQQNHEWVWHSGSLSNEEVFAIGQQSSLFILPSRVETFGRVIVEAQLCGLPVIATNVGGIPEIVVDKVTGWLVEPESVEALTSAVLEVCRNISSARAIGGKAQAFAQANFSFAATAQQFEQLYTQVIKHRDGNFGQRTAAQP